MSPSEVHWCSTASMRNAALSSLIHFSIDSTISSCGRCRAAISKASFRTAADVGASVRSLGLFSSALVSAGASPTTRRRRSWASVTPCHDR